LLFVKRLIVSSGDLLIQQIYKINLRSKNLIVHTLIRRNYNNPYCVMGMMAQMALKDRRGKAKPGEMELARGRIDLIELNPRTNGSGIDATLYGALAQILAVCSTRARNKKTPRRNASGLFGILVAGAGFEPAAFRL